MRPTRKTGARGIARTKEAWRYKGTAILLAALTLLAYIPLSGTFASQPNGTITGVLWIDENGNGLYDGYEAAVPEPIEEPVEPAVEAPAEEGTNEAPVREPEADPAAKPEAESPPDAVEEPAAEASPEDPDENYAEEPVDDSAVVSEEAPSPEPASEILQEESAEPVDEPAEEPAIEEWTEDPGETVKEPPAPVYVSEPTLSGYTVYLYDAADLAAPIDQTYTDENGEYAFKNLGAGSYVVGVRLSTEDGAYRLSGAGSGDNKFAVYPDIDPDMAYSEEITVAGSGETLAAGVSAGLLPDLGKTREEPEEQEEQEEQEPQAGGSISGFLWSDGDGTGETDWNGLYDAGEQPLAGFPVYLYAAADLAAPIDQTYTDENGEYSFGSLGAGSYVVGLTAGAAGLNEYLPPMAVTADSVFTADWDIDPPAAHSASLTITADEEITGVNGGMRRPMAMTPMAAIEPIDLSDTSLVAGGTYPGYTVAGTGNTKVLTFTMAANGNTYTIIQSGDSTFEQIVVSDGAGTALNPLEITIDGIDVTYGGSTNRTSVLEIEGTANVNLILEDENILTNATTAEHGAGLYVAQGATVTISGSGSLEATGKEGGAGIGGNAYRAAGTVNITSGTVTAQGGRLGAGIGSGSSSAGGTVNISGGTVYATGGSNTGAGIGGGWMGGGSGTVNITGGTVYAWGGWNSSGIGGCATSTNDTPAIVTISPAATVIAYGGLLGGAAIYSSVDIGGDIVNASFDSYKTDPTFLNVYANGGTTLADTLELPRLLTKFAYTTGGAPRTDAILAYDGTTLLGSVVRTADNSPEISSTNTNAVTGVKIVSAVPGTPRADDVTCDSATFVSTGQQIIAGGTYVAGSGKFLYSTSGATDPVTGLLDGVDVVDVAWSGFSTDPISAPVTGLQAETTYYLQAYFEIVISGVTVTVPGPVVPFTTPAAPTVIDLSLTTSGGTGYTVTGSTSPIGPGIAVASPDRVLTVTEDGTYRIIQSYGHTTSIFKQIIVAANVTATITIDNIDVKNGTNNEPIFALSAGTNVGLILERENILTHTTSAGTSAGYNNAALYVPEGAAVTISGNAGDSLYAQGGQGGAGIGGGGSANTAVRNAGTITINGGNVTARGGTFGAGIGGGPGTGANRGGSGGTVTINGGTVFGRGGDGTNGAGPAGIGGGGHGSNNALGGHGVYVRINDGTITARGNRNGAGIGGGEGGGNGGTVEILGGTVYAYSGQGGSPASPSTPASGPGAGIGGGYNGNPANLTISSAAVVKAYSRHPDRPAIHANGNNGDGFYVNAWFTAFPGSMELRVYPEGQTPYMSPSPVLDQYWVCFAYTTGNTEDQEDGILAYNAAGTTLLGVVVRYDDDNPEIPSTNGTSLQHVKLLSLTTLTVSKTVTGGTANLTKSFDFTVTFMDAFGNPLAAGTQFSYTGAAITGVTAPANGTFTLDEYGSAAFSLKHGQRIVIAGVPEKGKVRIVESDYASGYPSYTPSFKDSLDAEATSGRDTDIRTMTSVNRTFAFTNHRYEAPPTGIDLDDPGSVALLCVTVLLFALSVLLLREAYRRRWTE